MKSITLTRIDPISASKTVLLLYTIVIVVGNLASGITALLRGKASGFSAHNLLVMVIAVAAASLATLIVCLLYNLLAKITGGIRVEIDS